MAAVIQLSWSSALQLREPCSHMYLASRISISPCSSPSFPFLELLCILRVFWCVLALFYFYICCFDNLIFLHHLGEDESKQIIKRMHFLWLRDNITHFKASFMYLQWTKKKKGTVGKWLFENSVALSKPNVEEQYSLFNNCSGKREKPH